MKLWGGALESATAHLSRPVHLVNLLLLFASSGLVCWLFEKH